MRRQWRTDELQINPAAVAEQSSQLLEKVRPHFVGVHPFVVGVVLSELTALWLRGHHPEVRDEVYNCTLDVVRTLSGMNHNGHAE